MIVCDVCMKPSAQFFQNKFLLGSDDALCMACFSLWYEEGVTSREEMKRIREGEVRDG